MGRTAFQVRTGVPPGISASIVRARLPPRATCNATEVQSGSRQDRTDR